MTTVSSKAIGAIAVRLLRKGGHEGVMWGDVHLLHEIAAAAGIESNGSDTERRILNAIDRSGALVKFYASVRIGKSSRLVRSFYLPEHVPEKFKQES